MGCEAVTERVRALSTVKRGICPPIRKSSVLLQSGSERLVL